MRFIFLNLFCVCLVVCLGSASVRAAFVLDDFSSSSETTSPEMLGETVSVFGIGHLSATRELRIAATTSGERASIASLDTGVTVSGEMTANLLKVGSTQGNGEPLFAFQFNYIFSPTDVSQSGTNDAILFDFLSISGTESPAFLRAIVTDNTFTRLRFEARITDLPTNSGAFTAVMPFSSFTIRGGTPGLPDFSTFKRIDFDFFFLRPALEIQWAAQLENIRFGRVVPEPATSCLSVIAYLCMLN